MAMNDQLSSSHGREEAEYVQVVSPRRSVNEDHEDLQWQLLDARSDKSYNDSPQHRNYLKAVSSSEMSDQSKANTSTSSPPPTQPQSEQAKAPAKLVSVTKLFSFADKRDLFMLVLGTLCAIGSGVCMPLQVILFGDVINDMNPVNMTSGELSSEATKLMHHEMTKNINKSSLNFVYCGIFVLICSCLNGACFAVTSTRQSKRIRTAYMRAILAKEIGWFDVNEPAQIATRVADSSVTIQEGMGRKIGDSIWSLSMVVGGLVIGFIKGWQLTLVVMAFSPFLAASAYLSMKVMTSAVQTGLESYSKAGGIAQEALSNARTVQMFNSIQSFVKKYDDALQETVSAGVRKGLAVGWSTALVVAIVFFSYAGGMYYGAVKVADDVLGDDPCTHNCYNGGKILTVFFCVMSSAMGLGQAAPGIQAFFSARTAAYDIFQVIDGGSSIDPLSESGETLEHVKGKIELRNIQFAYPSRLDTFICDNYSLTINAGETVALVGPSGSGKSTIVSLLERFYDPIEGEVTLDGVNLRELNVRWLRQQIGFVGQEPALFATSILENIRNGNLNATNEQVYEAARQANAYSFIMEFPAGFATEVGERGTQLSGGQKQRIAIARAIIKNPAILLLDEATSALDTESERIVQESLDNLLKTSRRTTIIIAHRLSTVRDADRIAVHDSGRIVELGRHEELMRIEGGLYRGLVETQSRVVKQEQDSEKEDANNAVPDRRSGHSQRRVSSRKSSLVKSQHSIDEAEYKEMKDEDADDQSSNVPLSRIWWLTLPDWKYLLFGSIASTLNAAVYPVWGVLLTKITKLLVDTSQTRDEMLSEASKWCLGFVALAVIYASSCVSFNYAYSVVAQKLIARVRLMTFTSMLRQEIGWFDMEENNSGALIAQLATDTAVLHSMTTSVLNQMLVNVTTLTIGLLIAFYYSWQMTLALMALAPILVLASVIQMRVSTGTKCANPSDTTASAVLSESIGSIRTVASFGLEREFHSKYSSNLYKSSKTDEKKGYLTGIAYGMSQGLMFFNLAFLFWLGGELITHDRITFEDMFMVMNVIMFSTFAIGMATQDMGSVGQSKKAATSVFAVIDRKPLIDCVSDANAAKLATVQGDIEFQTVDFAYPSRPDSQVYKKYSLRIPPGKTVALVGASGSGKSTAISLMERFYDPVNGRVLLDGKDLKDLNVCWLRDRISLVSQEPVLFAGTIADNIALGKQHGATREEVIEAAKMANADSFIRTFPDGYDTQVGDRGVQVSGGQKQRIAIARAILRDPQVLLLDEATSALDNESERIVQESLDRLVALKKRTTVIVAHRLSTIRNADIIAVTSEGRIVELGTHDELVAIPNGVYRTLVSRQEMQN